MHEAIIKLKLTVAFALVLVTMLGCSAGIDPGDEEGGVIGTGIILKGTVTDVRAFANNTLQIKAQTGELSNAVVDDTGRYKAPSLKGAPPYLLRADLGNGEFRYGIAFDNEPSNIHSYSDVIIRNWFESNNGDIDFEFEQSAISTTLPSRTQYQNNANEFFKLSRLVLEANSLTSDDILFGDYDFADNNKGIDQYLRLNPVLVQDDTISFVITDPLTKTQSMTRSGFSLFELATEPDVESPEIPIAVRALASASNEVVVVWEPSFDNRGVVGYDLFRDGALVATTPYPVYVDTGLEADQSYSYEVSAMDASDNRSELSTAATSTTLAEPDVTPPPAPIQLTAKSALGRIELLWGQQSIGDVVSFDVYRGRDNDPIEFLTSVTSSVMTDVTVSSGVEYCYQIAAVDASGNESDRSVELCMVAAGDEVDSPNDTQVIQVPPLAGLTIPDVDTIECTQTWTEVNIVTAVTVDAGCFMVEESITISNGGRLSLSPGVAMKFGAATGVVVQIGGSFSALGSRSAPVILTAQDPTPGYWNGIVFQSSNSSRNKLVNTVVEYAGGGAEMAAIALSSDRNKISRVEISSSVIRECLGNGISMESIFDNLARLDGSIVTRCDAPLQGRVYGLSGVTQRNNFTGNISDSITLADAKVRDDVVLKDLGVPYVVKNLTVLQGSLRVLEGVEIQFQAGAQLLVQTSLVATGSASRPVIFTGTVEERGHWQGVITQGKATLNFVDINYAGHPSSSSEFSGGLVVEQQGVVSLNNVNINDSASYAVTLADNASTILSLKQLRMARNSRTMRIPMASVDQLGRQVIESDNNIAYIELVESDGTEGDVNVRDLGLPYFLADSINWQGGNLSIHPGVSMLMAAGVSITIPVGSTFSSIGTLNAPILLSSDTRIPGSWTGIKIQSSSVLNTISHTTISFAGASSNSVAAAIVLTCTGASLQLSDSSIEDSLGWGIASEGTGECDFTLGDNVQFIRNQSGDIGL